MYYLHEKTNEEVESSQRDEQQFKIHVRDVVQVKYSASDVTRVHHQPSHDAKEDEQQTEENHWKYKTTKNDLCQFYYI